MVLYIDTNMPVNNLRSVKALSSCLKCSSMFSSFHHQFFFLLRYLAPHNPNGNGNAASDVEGVRRGCFVLDCIFRNMDTMMIKTEISRGLVSCKTLGFLSSFLSRDSHLLYSTQGPFSRCKSISYADICLLDLDSAPILTCMDNV